MDTKEKILLAASEEFSLHGYKGTTTRSICEHAKVNVAAVNYHFNSKGLLYKHVVDYLFKKTSSEPFPLIIVESREEWEKEIYNWIFNILNSVTNTHSLSQWKSKILFMEILDPSEHFPFLFDKHFKPYFVPIEYYIRCGAPESSSKEDIYIIIFSSLAQCLFYRQNEEIVKQLFGDKFLTEHNRMETIARYIANGVSLQLNFRKEVK